MYVRGEEVRLACVEGEDEVEDTRDEVWSVSLVNLG